MSEENPVATIERVIREEVMRQVVPLSIDVIALNAIVRALIESHPDISKASAAARSALSGVIEQSRRASATPDDDPVAQLAERKALDWLVQINALLPSRG